MLNTVEKEYIKSAELIELQKILDGAGIPFPAPVNAKFTFIDLFAGIGGMRIAFQNLGGKCVFSSEIDEYAQKTYVLNFGELPAGDITKIDENTIPDHDVLLAGFPVLCNGTVTLPALRPHRLRTMRHKSVPAFPHRPMQ